MKKGLAAIMWLENSISEPVDWLGDGGVRHRYRIHGLEFESDLPCPGLPAGGESPPDLRLCIGKTPLSLPDATDSGYKFEARPGALLLTTRHIADFFVTRGDEILTRLKPDCRPTEFHNLLFGWVLSALLHQREAFPLHGAALAQDGRGLILCGDSGAGKSSIALGLLERGYRLLDDNLVVPRLVDGAVFIHPGQSRFKLTASHLLKRGADLAARSPMDRGGLKYAFDAGSRFADGPARIDRLFILNPGSGAEIDVQPLAGAAKLSALAAHTFSPHFLAGLGKRQAHFHHLLALAECLDCFSVQVPHDEQFPDALLDRLESIGTSSLNTQKG